MREPAHVGRAAPVRHARICSCSRRGLRRRICSRGAPHVPRRRRVDALLLSRIQFGFVISCHILFPAFTIGLASWLAFIEWRWLRTKDDLWRDLYFFWLK